MNSEHPAGYVKGAPAGTYDHSSRECLECACVQPFFKRYKVQEALRCTVCGKSEQHRKESAQASAEPPLSADTRNTATQSPPVDQSTQADAQTTGGAAGPNIHAQALALFGLDLQSWKVVEELGECLVAFARHMGAVHDGAFPNRAATAEEAADAEIVLGYVRQLVGSANVDAHKAIKLARLEALVQGAAKLRGVRL